MKWTIPKLVMSAGMMLTLAACDTPHMANQAGNAVKTVGNAVGNTAGMVGSAVGNTVTKAGQVVGTTATKAGQVVGTTATKAGHVVGTTVTKTGHVAGAAAGSVVNWPASVTKQANTAWNGKLEQTFQFDDHARILRIVITDSQTSHRGAQVGLAPDAGPSAYRGTTDAMQGVTGMGPFPNRYSAHPVNGVRTWMEQGSAQITIPVGWHVIVKLQPNVGHLMWAETNASGTSNMGTAMQSTRQLSIPLNGAGRYTLYAAMNKSKMNVVDTIEVTTKRMMSPTVK